MSVRVAQQAAEALLTGTPKARVAQQAAEVLLTPGSPKARAAQQTVEVLRSTWDAYPITVAIANPGAESADAGNEPSSWTETSGDWESVASISGDFPIASPQEGTRFFYQQGAMAEAVLEQTVQLYNVPDADIDGGSLAADVSAQHVGTGGWVEVTNSGAMPPGARQVRIKLRAVLVAGSVPNVAFDDVSLVIEEEAGGGAVGQSSVLVVPIVT